MTSWWNAAVSGNGAWARQARQAMMAAGERRVTINPESLITFDVRDLQALSLQLRQRRRWFSVIVGGGREAALSARLR